MTEHSTSTARGRVARRVAGAGLALLATAGVGIAGAGSAQAAEARSTTPTCTTSGLTASFGQKLGGGMNHEGVVLKLTNTSGHDCALRGYAGLGLEDSEHRTLSSTAEWGNTWYAQDPGKETLTLDDGESAEAVVSWTHANTGTSEARHASYLQVTPPANTAHKTLQLPAWVDNGRLQVTAFSPHAELNG
ncbi:DUF4232 domain-containing protein [Streptomyces tubbatahanensis]|uniref:DUF4232 domain-containing protein n=1 Tax=Streptomyces tubbatahanensis TaxID=2923272 RepID=A0ABY3Y1C1_9ACTN|nr:DUF4232 domain-containing protein [Streptomyces tubbatahanensis]UNT00417.1 DUF4232 domain-containing protein [Streptomyces tubbatahanensis]